MLFAKKGCSENLRVFYFKTKRVRLREARGKQKNPSENHKLFGSLIKMNQDTKAKLFTSGNNSCK